jgi:hypothetical protein
MPQDRPFFPHERDSMIAAIIHFDDAPLETGCVCMVPVTPLLGALEREPDGGRHLPLEAGPVQAARRPPTPPGPRDGSFVQRPPYRNSVPTGGTAIESMSCRRKPRE